METYCLKPLCDCLSSVPGSLSRSAKCPGIADLSSGYLCLSPLPATSAFPQFLQSARLPSPGSLHMLYLLTEGLHLLSTLCLFHVPSSKETSLPHSQEVPFFSLATSCLFPPLYSSQFTNQFIFSAFLLLGPPSLSSSSFFSPSLQNASFLRAER